ncbi:MAG TPA: hypothetical protein IGR64_18775 [Leptolyngbyaceae cyanobacterium M65_K2018_010]|nr:hypothetical protein [Leptolyngbyaceae cyanobacterium M65_K2018_010]
MARVERHLKHFQHVNGENESAQLPLSLPAADICAVISVQAESVTQPWTPSPAWQVWYEAEIIPMGGSLSAQRLLVLGPPATQTP